MAMPKTKYDFDAVDELQEVGFSQDQGRAMVRIFHEMQAAELATKADIADLRTDMASLELRLTDKMASMYTKLILWIIGTGLTCVGLGLTIFKLIR